MQTIAGMYHGCGSWKEVLCKVMRENTLNCRTHSALERIAGELVKRLEALADDEVARFVGGRADERRLFAWLAACRHYALVGDFAVEALHEAYISGQKTFTRVDYEKFINSKRPIHPELDSISDKTYAKIRQVIFKMMLEAGFLDQQKNIIPVVMDKDLANFFPAHELTFFPMYIGGR